MYFRVKEKNQRKLNKEMNKIFKYQMRKGIVSKKWHKLQNQTRLFKSNKKGEVFGI